MEQNKVFKMLGLAARGSNLVSGEFQTVNAIRNGTARLVIVSRDAGENTRKLFTDKCSFYNVPFYFYGTSEELGHSIGRELRSSLAVCNAGLAESIIKDLEAEEEENGGR